MAALTAVPESDGGADGGPDGGADGGQLSEQLISTGRRADLRGRPALGRLIAISSARFADEFWATSPLLARSE